MRFSTIILHTYLSESNTDFSQCLSEEETKRRDRRFPRCTVRPYFHSSFLNLFLSKNNQAFINACGHDNKSFNSLLLLFRPYYKYWTVDIYTNKICLKQLFSNGKPMGRDRDMPACGCLGLVLMWYRTRGSCTRGLALMFGQTSSPLHFWLKFGRRILLHVLSRTVGAKTQLSNENEIRTFQEAISIKYLSCGEVWGAMDGLKLIIQSPKSFVK